MAAYLDLHRHAATRAAMLSRPDIALRLMLAHAIAGSPLWTVRVEPCQARSDAVRESVEASPGEALFCAQRLQILATLGLDSEPVTIHQTFATPQTLVRIFLHLLTLDDKDVMQAIPIVMGETLAAGHPVVEALGQTLDVDMSDWWEADDAFFGLIRDREILREMLAEVGGPIVAQAHAAENSGTLKALIADHLAGYNDRPKADRWVPRWMRFRPSGYTERGSIPTVEAHLLVEQTKAEQPAPDSGDTSDMPPAA
jgi:ParB family chromosome partitioning protein